MPDVLDDIRSAMCHRQAGRVAEAEAACRRVLAKSPDHPDALHLLGVLALQAGRLDDAVDLLRRAIRARPTFAEAYNNLGVALDGRDQHLKAEWAFRFAARIDPSSVSAYCNLGGVLRKQQQPWEADDAFRAALALRPDDPRPHGGLGATSLELGRQAEAIRHYRKWSELQLNSAVAHSDLLFWLLHDPNQTPDSLFAEHRRWSERHEKPLANAIRPHANDRTPNRRLRLGYVSSDFREHPTIRFLEPLLEHHDREQFAVFCYSDVKRPDHVTARVRAYSVEWRDTARMSDDHLADLIRADRIDILIDPQGHMGGNRLATFARRPAPVQISYLYPHSTGLDAMDWRLTDEHHDPPGLTEQIHTEKLLRVEGGCAFCYRPTEYDPPVGGSPALRNGHVTFGSLNRTAKLHPQLCATWAEVLRAVPGSRLLVLATGGESNRPVRDLLEQNGVEPARLTLAPTGPRPDYLALADRVDLLLDPFPYAGMTTTCDFLWMGVPTVTLAADRPQSRAGASLLGAVGLSKFVTPARDDYVRTAAGAARDPRRLADLRETLRERVQDSPLRDERGQTARIEAAYRRAWHGWCSSRE